MKLKPPPCRDFRCGLFGFRETRKSIQKTKDYKIYMQGYRDGVQDNRSLNE